jgi:hypothetical protein
MAARVEPGRGPDEQRDEGLRLPDVPGECRAVINHRAHYAELSVKDHACPTCQVTDSSVPAVRARAAHPARGTRGRERKGVRLAQKMQVGQCIPVGVQL